jgi:hypothetical protein
LDLKEFIKESLVQISGAITEANEDLKGSGAMINPLHVTVSTNPSQAYGRTGTEMHVGNESRVVEKVEFDVAVYAEEGSQTKAGFKLSVVSIGLGASGQSNNKDKSESRIKFCIPVVYPGVDSNPYEN